MATHSSILAWRIPWTEEPGWHSPQGHKETDMTEQLSTAHTSFYSTLLHCIFQILNFLQIEFVTPLHQASLLGLIFQHLLITSCLCVTV